MPKKTVKVGFLHCILQEPKTIVEETWVSSVTEESYAMWLLGRHQLRKSVVSPPHDSRGSTESQYWQGMYISWWVGELIFITEDSFPVIDNGAK